MDISVVVCTHNPRPDCLHRMLDSLKGQTLCRGHWELLIVDNASDNRVSDTCDVSWHERARHVREETLGLTPARLRGIAEADGDLLVFVDDDNLLAPEFLEEASRIYDRYPYLGVFGAGSLEPEFEVEPPPEIRPYLDLLALRNVTEVRWSNNVKDHEVIPWGAGLCVSRPVAESYRRLVGGLGFEVTAVLGRRGQELFSGEDDVFSWVAASVGRGFGVFPQLRLIHVIPAGRVSRRYFLRLIREHTFSHYVRRYMLTGAQPRRIDGFRYVHLLLHGVRNGQFSMQCQWAASGGEDAAARFVVEKQLQPVDLRGLLDVHPVPSRVETAAADAIVSRDQRPHVSIIVPVFNQGNELSACLRALKGQTYQDGGLEVIVVDNGSNPPICEVADPFSFVHCISEPKPGSYAARNSGIRAARGEVIGFTDADCVPAADWIERGVGAVRGLPGPGMVGGAVELTFQDPRRLTAAELFESVFAFPQDSYITHLGFSVTANLFTTRATVDDVGLFDETLMSGGDVEWGQRVRARGFAQKYADDMRISHAARRTLGQLCKQSLRVAGGVQQIADRRGQGTAGLLAQAIAQLVLLRNIRANVSGERLAGLGRKLRFATVVWFVELLRILERYRVHWGGRPWRT